MVCSIVKRGLSEAKESWKTICRFLRNSLRAMPPYSATPSPSNTILPLSGLIKRAINLAVVDLPQPDSPTMPSVLPLATEKLTLSTAWTNFFSLAKSSLRTGKYFLSSLTTSNGWAGPPRSSLLRMGVFSCAIIF